MRNEVVFGLFVLLTGALPAPGTAATRYVPSQYPTIGSAVAVAVPGDIIEVSPNITPDRQYHENVVISTRNLTLESKTGAVLDGTGLVGTDGIDVNANNFTLRGMTIQNYLENPFGFPFTGGNGVNAQVVTNLQIIANSIQRNTFGLVTDGTTGAIIMMNLFMGNQSLALDNLGISTSFSQNTVTNNGSALSFSGAVNWFSANGGAIQGNYVSNNVNDGIDISDSPPTGLQPQQIMIQQNRVINNGGSGISVTSSEQIQINNNTVSGNVTGIFVSSASGVSASNNVVSGSGSDGIFIDFNVTFCTFSNNQVIGNGAVFGGNGIDLGPDGGVSNCMIRNNLVNANQADGIFVEAGNTGNTLNNNTALGNLVFDAEDDTGATAATVQNIWMNNIFGTTDPPGLP